MTQIISLFQAAVVFGTVILFGAVGEILAEKAGNQRGCGKCAMLHRMSPKLVFVCHHRVVPGGSMHTGNGCLIEWFRD